MGRVFYATNRNPDNAANPTSFGIDFNGAQPGALTFGVADVAAPSGHDPQGLPFEAAGPGDVQLSLTQAGDLSATAKQLIIAGPPHLVISVHGFQYLFWEAIARADYVSRWFAEGQFANPNTVIAFTWPSAGVFSEYQRDWTYSTNSAGALAKVFLALVALLIPDMKAFDLLSDLHHGDVIAQALFWQTAGLGGLYVAIYFLVGYFIFAGKERILQFFNEITLLNAIRAQLLQVFQALVSLVKIPRRKNK